MADPENINPTQYHLSQKEFVQLSHIMVKLPNGTVTNFDWDKTYIINAINATGQQIEFVDTNSSYTNIDNTLKFVQTDESSWIVYVNDIGTRLIQGVNITIKKDGEPNIGSTQNKYVRYSIAAADTKYQMIVGSGKNNVEKGITTNGNTYITFQTQVVSSSVPEPFKNQNQYLISGAGIVDVSTDRDGNIQVYAPNTNVDTTYISGRFINVNNTGDNPHAINSTLKGDGKTINISGNADESSGIIELKPADRDGLILSTTLVGNVLSAGWVSPSFSTTDTKYSLHSVSSIPTNGQVKFTLKKNGAQQDNIFISGINGAKVTADTNGTIIVDSKPPIEYTVVDPLELINNGKTIQIKPGNSAGLVLKTLRKNNGDLYVTWDTDSTGGSNSFFNIAGADNDISLSLNSSGTSEIHIKGSGEVNIEKGNDDITIGSEYWINEVVLPDSQITSFDADDKCRYICKKAVTINLPTVKLKTGLAETAANMSVLTNWEVPKDGMRVAVFSDTGGNVTILGKIKGETKEYVLPAGAYAEFVYEGSGDPREVLNNLSQRISWEFPAQTWALVNINNIKYQTGLDEENVATLSCFNDNFLRKTINFRGEGATTVTVDDTGDLVFNSYAGGWDYVLLNTNEAVSAQNNTKYVCVNVGSNIDYEFNSNDTEPGDKYGVYTGSCSTCVQGNPVPPNTYIQLVWKQLTTDQNPKWYVAEKVDLTNPTLSAAMVAQTVGATTTTQNAVKINLLNNGQEKTYTTLSGLNGIQLSAADDQIVTIKGLPATWNNVWVPNNTTTISPIDGNRYIITGANTTISNPTPAKNIKIAIYTAGNYTATIGGTTLPQKSYKEYEYYNKGTGNTASWEWREAEYVDLTEIGLSTQVSKSNGNVKLYATSHGAVTTNYKTISGAGGTEVVTDAGNNIIISGGSSWNNVWLTGSTNADKSPVIKSGNRYICSANDTTTISAGKPGVKIAVYTAGATFSANIDGLGTLVPHSYKELEWIKLGTETTAKWHEAEYVDLTNVTLSTAPNLINGEVKVHLLNKGNAESNFTISGIGNASVTTDDTGNIVINSTGGERGWDYGVIISSNKKVSNNTKYILTGNANSITYDGTPVGGQRFGIYTQSFSGTFDGNSLPSYTYTEFYRGKLTSNTTKWEIVDQVDLAQTHLYIGSGTTAANNATSNGNVKIKLFNNKTAGDEHYISGTGGALVTSDADGNIIFNSGNWTNSFVTSQTAATFNGIANTRYVIQDNNHTINDNANLGSGDKVAVYTGEMTGTTIIGKSIPSGVYAEFQCKVVNQTKTWETVVSANVIKYPEDGLAIIKTTNNVTSINSIPPPTDEDGMYVLTCTKSGNTYTYGWIATTSC